MYMVLITEGEKSVSVYIKGHRGPSKMALKVDIAIQDFESPVSKYFLL